MSDLVGRARAAERTLAMGIANPFGDSGLLVKELADEIERLHALLMKVCDPDNRITTIVIEPNAEIERLEAENAKLRRALQSVCAEFDTGMNSNRQMRLIERARAALEGKE
jgi:hypothetical protein